jgi:hypothetical protein
MCLLSTPRSLHAVFGGWHGALSGRGQQGASPRIAFIYVFNRRSSFALSFLREQPSTVLVALIGWLKHGLATNSVSLIG